MLPLCAVPVELPGEHGVVPGALVERRRRDEARVEQRRVARTALLVAAVLPLAARAAERVSRLRDDRVHQRAVNQLWTENVEIKANGAKGKKGRERERKPKARKERGNRWRGAGGAEWEVSG